MLRIIFFNEIKRLREKRCQLDFILFSINTFVKRTHINEFKTHDCKSFGYKY